MVETNLVWFEVDPDLATARDIANRLKEKNVLLQVIGPQTLRACTHLDVSSGQAVQAAELLQREIRRLAPAIA